MTPSYDGFKYIMLITDGMSKFAEICPMRNMTAPAVVKNVVERNWIARHGIPSSLLSDQGAQVDGKEVRELCDKYRIQKKRSSPYHPEGDGISERPIGVMKGIFRSKIEDKKLAQRKWTDIVPEVQLAMNQKIHLSTGKYLFQLYRIDRLRDTREPSIRAVENHNSIELNTEERQQHKENHINEAKTKLELSAEQMKKQYDKNTNETPLEIGDLVYVQREYVKKGFSKKLSTTHNNLSIVMDVNHPIYKIKRVGSENTAWVHHNRLRKKKTFENPDKPGNKIESDIIEDLDDDEWEVDYPIIINNTKWDGVGNSVNDNQTMNHVDSTGDNADIISLDENAKNQLTICQNTFSRKKDHCWDASSTNGDASFQAATK